MGAAFARAEVWGDLQAAGGVALGAIPDLLAAEETRRNWPFLRDRRIDAYAPILSRFLGS